MPYLFIDTETTDLPKKHGDLKQDGQARVCQVAMLLTDETGKSLSEFSCLIKPDNWTIGKIAGKTHGFTDGMCYTYGINAKSAFMFYRRMSLIDDILIVAHNIAFDKKLMEIEAAYCEMNFPESEWFCTMEACVPILNLPPTEKMLAAGFNKPKSPSLEEALQFMCGKSLGDTAHDALWDVKGCRDIYFALRERELNGETV